VTLRPLRGGGEQRSVPRGAVVAEVAVAGRAGEGEGASGR
jgi:hypothetical protein